MSDQQKKPRSKADAELEREILKGRKFTLAEAIGRLAGPGAMKGVSPIPRMQQAEVEIESWLRSHLADAGGELKNVLHRQVKGSDVLLNNFDQPLIVLASYCQRVLDSDYLLEELVRECDVEWVAPWVSGPTSRNRALRKTRRIPTQSRPSETL